MSTKNDTTNTIDIDDSAARFANIELDLDGEPSAADRQPVPTVEVGDVLPHAASQAARERTAFADATGVELSGKKSVDGLWFDEGTKMLDSGVAVAKSLRTEWDRLPTAIDAAATHVNRIASERRSDYRGIALADLKVDDRGVLTRANGGLRFTEQSWSQLRTYAPGGAVVKNNFNGWLPDSDRELTFRTRFPNVDDRTRQLYAVVSDSYAIADGHELLKHVVAELPSETRARVSYDTETTRLQADCTLQNPYELDDDIAVGRLHRLGIRLSTRDDGRGAIRLQAYVERIRCINCTLLPQSWASVERIHVGDTAAIHGAIGELLGRASAAMREFSELWRDAHMVRVFGDEYEVGDVQSAFAKLIDGGFISAGNRKRDELAKRLTFAWSQEPGTSLQSLNRAVTLAAHRFTDWRADEVEDLEQTAGAMLYQQVKVCNQLGW